MKTSQTQSNTQGFTIIETLVAITILMIAIAGPLTVANKALTAAVYARDQMIASYLAQDGMEYVKNVRSTDKLTDATGAWLRSFSSCGSSSTYCKVDTVKGIISQDNSIGGSGDQLYLTVVPTLSSNPFYTHDSSGIPTQFHRYFNVVPSPANASEAEITMTVSWQTGTLANSVILHNTIYDVLQ